MQKTGWQFNVRELFDSLSVYEREQINCAIRDHASKRDQERYSRLEKAEIGKQALIQELEMVEYEISDNDEWFHAAQRKDVEVTTAAINLHRTKARELYFRKKSIIDQSLPSAESYVQGVVAQIEAEERKESAFQEQDLKQFLEPIYEAQMRERSRTIVAQVKEQQKRREEEETRRQQECEELLAHIRAEELERRRGLEAERRKTREEELRVRVRDRKIPYLIHFSPLNNLGSILQDGLRSRNALVEQDFVITDERRTDGWLDWISVSVSFPNYKMLYTKQNSLKDVKGWVILLIRREALWELDCKFILTNAASSGIRMFGDDRWSSVEAFEDMFGNTDDRINIPECYTTDPQAEVMIRNEIPRSYIAKVAVENRRHAKSLSNLTDIQIEVLPQLFMGRSDYVHWRQRRLSIFSSKSDLIEFI